jgi:hypothetical protein
VYTVVYGRSEAVKRDVYTGIVLILRGKAVPEKRNRPVKIREENLPVWRSGPVFQIAANLCWQAV